jgi:hypothetical protein
MLGLPSHANAGAEHARHAVGRSGEPTPPEVLQESAKPVSTDAAENTNQGMSVALSADGSTIVGGPGPNNVDRGRMLSIGPAGAAWIFIRRGDVWAQQGGKLVGTTNAPGGGLFAQGAAVALSADGNTAIVGGPSDNRTTGAAWVFVRSGSIWEQQGDKLVGTSARRVIESGLPLGQSTSVALSADGDTAIVGGWRAEEAWVFTAVVVSGRSKERSWSARALWEPPAKACRSRCPPMATPRLSGGQVTVLGIDRCPLVSDRRAQHGYLSATRGLDAAGDSLSAAALWEPPGRACPSPYPLTVTSRS